jgi:hypothetical protein
VWRSHPGGRRFESGSSILERKSGSLRAVMTTSARTLWSPSAPVSRRRQSLIGGDVAMQDLTPVQVRSTKGNRLDLALWTVQDRLKASPKPQSIARRERPQKGVLVSATPPMSHSLAPVRRTCECPIRVVALLRDSGSKGEKCRYFTTRESAG